MRDRQQIDDQQATLRLAQQIGLRPGCSPTLRMPDTVQKFTSLHRKLVQRHFQMNTQRSFLSSMTKTSNLRRKGMNSMDLSMMNESQVKREDTSKTGWSWELNRTGQTHTSKVRSHTSHTTKANNSKPHNSISINRTQKQQTQDNTKARILKTKKQLLKKLWNEYQTEFNVVEEIRVPKTQRKTKQNSIRIKFNHTVKSFQFV